MSAGPQLVTTDGGGAVKGRLLSARQGGHVAKDYMAACEAARWTQGQLLALSHARCRLCYATGQVYTYGGAKRPCGCVYRKIFRDCMAEYRRIRSRTVESTCGLYRHGARTGKSGIGWHRPQQAYVCDFELLARRVLSERERYVFEHRLVAGVSARSVGEQLGMPRHAVNALGYEVEAILGQVYAETTPYGLWPIGEYYATGQAVAFEAEQHEWPWQVEAWRVAA